MEIPGKEIRKKCQELEIPEKEIRKKCQELEIPGKEIRKKGLLKIGWGPPNIVFILRAQKNYLPPGQFFSNCFQRQRDCFHFKRSKQDRVFKENTTILRDQKAHGVPF